VIWSTAPRRLVALTSLVVLCAMAAPFAARAVGGVGTVGPIGQAGASATDQAVRINRLCTRVWMIGDSLTVGSAPAIRSGLERLELEAALVDGVNNRRIPATAPISGVLAARSIRAEQGEANCWVIALGTNDISNGVTTTSRARAVVAEMLAEVTPDARVWWVNVDFRSLDGTTYFPDATRTFNAVLDERAASDLRFEVIDWYTLAEGHPEWFLKPDGTADAVHVNATGYAARAALVVDVIRRNTER
jgi:lysophospholipase L1-like esterase